MLSDPWFAIRLLRTRWDAIIQELTVHSVFAICRLYCLWVPKIRFKFIQHVLQIAEHHGLASDFNLVTVQDAANMYGTWDHGVFWGWGRRQPPCLMCQRITVLAWVLALCR